MKLEVPESNIEIFGVKETHEMTVKQTDKLFRMMVDGLYKDKYGSVVRELSSNAIDAHVSAGIPDVPFEINLPTEFAGKFSIRDFGNGLCKEDIIKYFGKLLESSKEDDNSAHGAFGIGCKSPFAVVDDFMVISINKGIKTGVTFIRENKGVPKFFITSETETDEQSGTIIIIDDRNTNKWKDAVRSQLAGLSVKPIVNCEIDYPDIKYYNNIGFVNSSNLPSRLYMNQSGILYPFNNSDIPGAIYPDTYNTLIYKCNIGDINVPPDRERIELTDSTIDRMREIINGSINSLHELMIKEFIDNFEFTHQYYKRQCNAVSSFIKNPILFYKDTLNKLVINDIYGDMSIYDLLFNTKFIKYTGVKSYVTTYNIHPTDLSIQNRIPSTLYNTLGTNRPVIIINGTNLGDIHKYCTDNNITDSITVINIHKRQTENYVEILKKTQSFFGHTSIIHVLGRSTTKAVPRPPAEKKASHTHIRRLNSNKKWESIDDTDVINIVGGTPVYDIDCYGEFTNRMSTDEIILIHQKETPIYGVEKHKRRYVKHRITYNVAEIFKSFKNKNEDEFYRLHFTSDSIRSITRSDYDLLMSVNRNKDKYLDVIKSQYTEAYVKGKTVVDIIEPGGMYISSVLKDCLNNIPLTVSLAHDIIESIIK